MIFRSLTAMSGFWRLRSKEVRATRALRLVHRFAAGTWLLELEWRAISGLSLSPCSLRPTLVLTRPCFTTELHFFHLHLEDRHVCTAQIHGRKPHLPMQNPYLASAGVSSYGDFILEALLALFRRADKSALVCRFDRLSLNQRWRLLSVVARETGDQ